MVYIKVLVVVLCSCFIQDALSVARAANPAEPRKQPAGTAARRQTASPRATTAQRSLTAPVPKQTAPVPKQTASAPKKPERAATTKRKLAAAPPPPPKYPALAQLADMFWDAAERVNGANAYGKLDVRAARNAMAGVLTSPAFWTAAVALAGKLTKTTHDARRAESRVRVCDAVASALTRPVASGDFERVAEQVYEAAASLDPTPYVTVVRDAVHAVRDTDAAVRFLDDVGRVVEAVKLDPAVVTKAFNHLRAVMNKSSLVTKSDAMTNQITRISMLINRNNRNKF